MSVKVRKAAGKEYDTFCRLLFWVWESVRRRWKMEGMRSIPGRIQICLPNVWVFEEK